jgi:hypothetical protein
MMSDIGLSEAISALREELASSIRDADGQDIRFRLGQIDLEFQVSIARAAEGHAGLKFWVVSAGAKASDTHASAHTVKVQLHAEHADGGEVWTADHSGGMGR